MKRFLIKTGLCSIILVLVEVFITYHVFPAFKTPYFIVMVIFFFMVTNMVHYQLLRIMRKNVRQFNPWFLGLNMAKMFVYFLFALTYLWFFREYAKGFLMSLFITYASFSILEIIEIIPIVKRKK